MSKFTQAFVNSFKAPAGKQDHIEWDDAMPGFGLRVQAKGSRVFVVQYKIGDKQRRTSLGKVGKVTLGAAQDIAQQYFAQVARRSDPAADRKKSETAASKTFELAAEDFIEYQTSKVSDQYLQATALSLRDRFKPLHGLALTDIERSTVATALRDIRKSHGPVSADRCRSHLSKFFNWALGEGLCENNPVDHTNKAAGEYKPRERVLTASELKKIWNSLEDDAFGRVAKLLVLTGQRRTEIGDLCWSEVDLDEAIIHLPGSRTKNGLAHDVPLSKAAVTILKSCPHFAGRDIVFGNGKGKGGFSGWSKAKAALDAKLELPHWTFHDFRRTAATIMNEIDVAPHVVEAVLNHISGSKAGVAGVYNRAKYNPQKRDALDRLAKTVASFVGPAKLRLVA